jgi:hypothetical protein
MSGFGGPARSCCTPRPDAVARFSPTIDGAMGGNRARLTADRALGQVSRNTPLG